MKVTKKTKYEKGNAFFLYQFFFPKKKDLFFHMAMDDLIMIFERKLRTIFGCIVINPKNEQSVIHIRTYLDT